MDEATIDRVKSVLLKYCNPKKEFDHVNPTEVAKEIIQAVKGEE